MSSQEHTHTTPTSESPNGAIIKVIGIGGGGGNAVQYMYKHGILGVTFCAINTDAQALANSPVPHKLQIGPSLTHGLGAGANPQKGKKAALESLQEIEQLLQGADMAFITAGMGGGTGTGAAPVVASVAQRLDILTVGIVTHPFAFEGKQKALKAQEGTEELKKYCDIVLVILNERLKEVLSNPSISEAFASADEVLHTAARSIADIVSVHTKVNLDFNDVCTVMKGAGSAIMGSGIAEGENRAIRATEHAIRSPLLDYKDLHGARKILLSIITSPEADFIMDELKEVTDYIQEQLGPDAEFIFGNGHNKELGEKVRITLIATGFKDGQPATKAALPHKAPPRAKQASLFEKVRPKAGTSHPHKLAHHKKEHFLAKSQSLLTTLKAGQRYDPTDEEVAEMLQVPAYVRQDVSLDDPPPDNPDEVVRHQLHGEA